MTTRSQGKIPLSRHPMFAPIVAMWFAALLGIGSFAIRTSVFENAVLALRIDALVPAAVPPLGFTARMLLALVVMLAGAALGYGLARLVARGGSTPAEAQYDRPIIVAQTDRSGAADPADSAAGEDDDLARLAAARSALPQRRRALTLDELPELPQQQPLARRTAPSVLNVGDLDAISPLAGTEPEAVATPQPLPEAAHPAPHPALDSTAAERLRAAPLGNLGIAELIERFALALAARRESQPRLAPQIELSPPPVPEILLAAPIPGPEAIAVRPAAPFIDDAAPAGLTGPNFTKPDSRPFAMPPSLRQPGLGNIEWFDEAEEEATLESLLPPKRPLANDPLRIDAAAVLPEIDHEGNEAGPEADVAEIGGEPTDDDGAPFSSLLDMKPSVRQPAALGTFVRIEDGEAADMAQPVVVFPGQTVPPPAVPARLPGAPFGASPVATEAALREALSALQKMSGTG